MKHQKRIIALLCAVVIWLTTVPMMLAESYTGTINEDGVFLRTYASTDAPYRTKLDKGEKVTVKDTKGDFYAVTWGKSNGYVMKKFVTLSSADAKKLSGYGKYTSAKTIEQLGDMPAASAKGDNGDKVAKLQQALKIKKFYTGKVDGIYGENTEKAVKAFQKSMGLTQTGKADKTTLKKLWSNATPKPTATPKPKATATPKAAAQSKSSVTSLSQITIPSPCRKGDKGNNVKYLQQALKLRGYYSGAIDGSYGDATEKAVIAFQKDHSLARDGVAGQTTIATLFKVSKSAVKGSAATPTKAPLKTERLDWFNGGSNVIPKKAVFIVMDVRTGKTFTCKRWAGANHLDAEPLTSSDTAVMKNIYGGNWSWNRRAVLVKYNGHVYAGSMNGMPHGTSTLNNNFPGHFCIHFYNSRTHGTNKVDAAHQNAVAQAMRASW